MRDSPPPRPGRWAKRLKSPKPWGRPHPRLPTPSISGALRLRGPKPWGAPARHFQGSLSRLGASMSKRLSAREASRAGSPRSIFPLEALPRDILLFDFGGKALKIGLFGQRSDLVIY